MRRFWAVALTLVAAFWLFVLIGLPLYVFPPVDEVHKSEVAFVLGPPADARLALAERLRDEGVVGRIVISVQPEHGQTADDIALCREPDVTCQVADPYTTRGEVLMMQEQGSPSVIVVTTMPHVARTRYLFGKCYSGDFTVVAADRPASVAQWAYQYAYQSVAFVKALFLPCAGEALGQ